MRRFDVRAHATVKAIALLMVWCLLPTSSGWAADITTPTAELQLVKHLPKESLITWATRTGNVEELYDKMLATVRKVVPEEDQSQVDSAIAELQQNLGINLRDDLLAHLGPEVALSIDIPPIDMAAGAVMSGAPDSPALVLGKIGLWIQVRNSKKVDQALRTMFVTLGVDLTEEDGVVRLAEAKAESAEPSKEPELAVFYSLDNGVLAIGFSSDSVRAMTAKAELGSGIEDGADFKKVFSHLDPGFTGMTYVNLPRLQEMLKASEMVKGALAGNEEAKPLTTLIFDSETVSTGVGITQVEVDGGVRQVTFGPSWMSGGAAAAGVIAAIAVPNFVGAVGRGRQKRTMADIRSLGTALEAFGIDNNRYPSSDGVWVGVDIVKDDLVPTYIRQVPTSDGWDNPIMFLSDGESYRIMSPGKGGLPSRDWSGTVDNDNGPTTNYEADIVYGDGVFICWPEGDQH